MNAIRINQRLFVPRFTDDGKFTRCYVEYKETGDFTEFVEDCTVPYEENQELWDLVNSKMGLAEALGKRLVKVKRQELLPDGQRDRDLHGFNNGILHVAKTLKQGKIVFFKQGTLAFERLNPLKIPCHYHDIEFRHGEFEFHLQHLPKNPFAFMAIETPIDKIISLQRWDRDNPKKDKIPPIQIYADEIWDVPPKSTKFTKEPIWIYAEGAALLYSKKTATHKLKAHLPCQVGTGGCGKTTLL